MKKYSRIIGTGSYLPQQNVSNKELEKWVDTTDEWIFDRTGIHSRHIAAHDETSASLGALAAKAALEAASIRAEDIDMIIVATSTPDYALPSTACVIQQLLGCHKSSAFDISAACSGFSYALTLADSMIKTQSLHYVLVIGTEVMSRMLDWKDRGTCVLFGDGAGAVVLAASEDPGLLVSKIHADGCYKDLLYTPNLQNLHHEQSQSPYLKMQGREVFKLAVAKCKEIIQETLNEIPKEYSGIDWLIPHQANIRIIKTLAEQISLPMEQVLLSLEHQGNTSAASIPLALDEGVRTGKVKPGDHLLLLGFGGGFTWASNFIRY